MGIAISAIRATLVNIIISYRERGDRLLERCLYLRGIDTTRVRVRARVRVRVRERERERVDYLSFVSGLPAKCLNLTDLNEWIYKEEK